MKHDQFTQKYLEMLLKPFQSIIQDGPIAFLVAVPTHFLMELYAATNELVVLEWKLAIAMVILIFIDLVTGVMSSRKKGDKISSLKLRQTGIKIVEYSMVLFAITVISNMADEINFIQKFGFVFLAMIELKSIVENLSDENGVIKQLFEAIRKAMDNRGQLPGA